MSNSHRQYLTCSCLIIFCIITIIIGCNKTTEPESDPMELQLIPTNVSVYGGSDGSIDLSVYNGTEPYQYQWSNGETTEDISNLIARTYSVTVMDYETQVKTGSILITEPEPTDPQDCDNCTDLTGLYLGQDLPGETPQLFEPFINSNDIFEFGYVFSLDGQECFFTRNGGIYETNSIMMTHIENGYWTEPEIAPFTNNDYNLALSINGRELYFNSYRNFPDYSSSQVLFSTKTNNGWSQAVDTGINAVYLSITDEGTLYHFQIINGKQYITRSRKVNGNFEPLELLPAPINSDQYDNGHPCIAPDESYLIFNSTRPGIGDCGLFVSFNNGDDSWTEPVNMGTILTQVNPGMQKISIDGKYLFFNDWNGDNYWVDASIIDEFRPNNGSGNTVTDFDGNVYSTVKIGDQWWMAENLQTTHKSNGTLLNGVYAYDDDENYVAEYGRLYNWQAALDASLPGWHLPSDGEWDVLINTVGSNPVFELSDEGSSGFNVKFGGLREREGGWDYLNELGIYWTSNQVDATHAIIKLFAVGESDVMTYGTDKAGGRSVRYIKD